MVNVWEHRNARAEAQWFCQVHNVDGTVLLDEDASYISHLGIRGVPTNVVVGEDGVVTAVGATSPEDMLAALADLSVDLDLEVEVPPGIGFSGLGVGGP